MLPTVGALRGMRGIPMVEFQRSIDIWVQISGNSHEPNSSLPTTIQRADCENGGDHQGAHEE
eukprot:16004-Prorocentrum_lima.AAC.1